MYFVIFKNKNENINYILITIFSEEKEAEDFLQKKYEEKRTI